MFPLKDNIPTDRFPAVTVALIAINVFVYFVLQKGGFSGPGDAVVVDYGAIPYELSHWGKECALEGQQVVCPGDDSAQPATVLTLFSSMFMHGGILHLGGNMLFLWI